MAILDESLPNQFKLTETDLSYGSRSASLDFCSLSATVILNVANDSGSIFGVEFDVSDAFFDFSLTETSKFDSIAY